MTPKLEELEQRDCPSAAWVMPSTPPPMVQGFLGALEVIPPTFDPKAMTPAQTSQLQQALINGGVVSTPAEALAKIDEIWARYADGILPAWNMYCHNYGYQEWVDTNVWTPDQPETLVQSPPTIPNPLAVDTLVVDALLKDRQSP